MDRPRSHGEGREDGHGCPSPLNLREQQVIPRGTTATPAPSPACSLCGMDPRKPFPSGIPEAGRNPSTPRQVHSRGPTAYFKAGVTPPSSRKCPSFTMASASGFCLLWLYSHPSGHATPCCKGL